MRFDAGRGFGFVALDGGAGDAFLHVSTVQRAGADTVAPGTRLRVRYGQGQKGLQVTEVLEVGEVTEVPPPPTTRTARAGLDEGGGFGAGEEVRGTVKWYNAEKGFGFIAVDGGGKDVFVHRSVLMRAGLDDLPEGQRVMMTVVQGRKGPEAQALQILR
jgi:CspA family cold shock protein